MAGLDEARGADVHGAAVRSAAPGVAVVHSALVAAVVLATGLGALAGCSGPFPRDTDGSLEQVTGGTLKVGVSENPPWTVVHDDDRVSGREADLVAGFAATRDATIEWIRGPESELVAGMARGDLHVVVGGLTADSPWSEEVALTRAYAQELTPDGDTEQMVMATPLGENALLVALETYLAGTGEAP